MNGRKDTRYKWVMLALLAFTYFLMHATRQVFNASFTDIKASIPGTTDAQWGFTRTVFLFAYGLAVRSQESRRTCSAVNGSSSLAHSYSR